MIGHSQVGAAAPLGWKAPKRRVSVSPAAAQEQGWAVWLVAEAQVSSLSTLNPRNTRQGHCAGLLDFRESSKLLRAAGLDFHTGQMFTSTTGWTARLLGRDAVSRPGTTRWPCGAPAPGQRPVEEAAWESRACPKPCVQPWKRLCSHTAP